MMNVSAGSRSSGPLVTILLIADPVREDWRSDVYQVEINQVEQALRAAGVRPVPQLGSTRENDDLSSRQLGGFTVEIDSLDDAGLTVVKSWMQKRSGRKVRIRASDLEVDASTPQETEHLLGTIKLFSTSYDEIL